MTIVVSMWSGPRNISTTMMRSFGNRPDTTAVDEPFYGYYLTETGAHHPYREETLKTHSRAFDDVLQSIEIAAGRDILFLKQIAYHMLDERDFSFLRGWRNFLLIRDPRAMVASFAGKFEDVTPIVKSYEIELRIRAYLSARLLPCPIVDAADLLEKPEPMLRALCGALGLPFDPAMLSWPPGPRPEDGPWAPHWYEAVWASTGFLKPVEKTIRLSNALEGVAAAALPAYRSLLAQRLTA